jgi:hypothetical protein
VTSDKSGLPETSVSGSLVATITAVAGISGHAGEAVAVAAVSSALQPLFEEQLHWVVDVIRRFGRRRRITATSLEAELTASPAKQELLIRALDVARTASAVEKRQAIATSIAEGFESDLAATRENDVLRVIADLDLAHVLALHVMSRPRPLLEKAAFLGPANFETEDLGRIDERLIGLEDRLVAVLVSQGLVSNETLSTYDKAMNSWRITTYGRIVSSRYELGGQDDPVTKEQG